jgi:hypothetical protein
MLSANTICEQFYLAFPDFDVFSERKSRPQHFWKLHFTFFRL